MRMLWDKYPELPYMAIAPWPVIEYNGQADWVASVDLVESWLASSIGPHYVAWTWSMWTLHQSGYCSVNFLRERDTTLFLLKWG